MENNIRFFFEWGNEKPGYVSVGHYVNDEYRSLGQMKKEDAVKEGLQHHCPFS